MAPVRMKLALALLAACAAALACPTCRANTVVPGYNAKRVVEGETLQVHVNALYSNTTAVKYGFYTLPFCKPKGGKVRVDESLGEYFLGGRIENSAYEFSFLHDESLATLCEQTPNEREARLMQSRIRRGYKARMILDKLPVTRLNLEKYFDLVRQYGANALADSMDEAAYIGFDLGGGDTDPKTGDVRYYVHNHLTFSVLYKEAPAALYYETNMGFSAKKSGELGAEPPQYHIVGFEVLPCSATKSSMTSDSFDPRACDSTDKQYIDEGAPITFSYSVFFEKSTIDWEERWQPFLHVRGRPMHWYTFLDSLVIASLLAVLVASILLKTVRSDIRRYEARLAATVAEIESSTDETGWKLVSGDVLRPPSRPERLCIYIGSGTQVALCLMISIMLMAFGLISPIKPGSLLTWIIVTYFILAVLGGYLCTKSLVNITRTSDGWRMLNLKMGLFLPGIILLIVTVLNIVLGIAKSSQAVPFMPMFIVIVMWALLSMPLTFIGGYFASRTEPVKYPVRVNQIPREIKPRRHNWATHPVLLIMMSGLLPFGVMYIDLYFIFTAMFENLYYYAFGFLFAMCIITGIVCVEMSIVSTYVTLCVEDYRWWWKSFLCGGAVSLYFFLYGLSFLIFDSGLKGGLSAFVFLCYLGIMSTVIYLGMGALSFSSAYLFVRVIYGQIKAD